MFNRPRPFIEVPHKYPHVDMAGELPEQLDTALRNIAKNGSIPMTSDVINKLILAGYITIRFSGGWIVNSKGREYLRKHP